MRLPCTTRWILALALLAPVLDADARDYDDQAKKSQEAAAPAVTVFVDADWGGREDGAAREISRAHAAFARHGYEVVDVEAYTENGDLEGFFITYRRR
jgi:hypothetical protein